MQRFRFAAVLMLAATMAVSAVGQDQEKKKKQRKKRGQRPSAIMQWVKNVKLTDEQKPKFAAFEKENGPKLKAIYQKIQSIMTTEQKKAQRAAMAQIKKDGTKGKARQAAIEKAIKLTDEQKEKRKAINMERNKLQTGLVAKMKKMLTEEQLETASFPKVRGQRKGKKKGDAAKKRKGKKKKDADGEDKKADDDK